MSEEEKFLLKQLLGLSGKAESRSQILFSDFLNMNEVDLFLQHQQEMSTKFQLYGGYEGAERQMVAFIPDALSFSGTNISDTPSFRESNISDTFSFHKSNMSDISSFNETNISYPIICLKVVPRHIKFAESLTHRDVLGACMHLGIERKLVGDILVREKESYIFCCERIVDFLTRELVKIRHTDITVSVYEGEITAFSLKKEAFHKTITSMRLDCVVASCCNISRSEAVRLIMAKLVFVNARNILKPDQMCVENDVLSVRGHGKYVLSAIHGASKKGKLRVTLERYV